MPGIPAFAGMTVLRIGAGMTVLRIGAGKTVLRIGARMTASQECRVRFFRIAG
jgi:hypothetical protein